MQCCFGSPPVRKPSKQAARGVSLILLLTLFAHSGTGLLRLSVSPQLCSLISCIVHEGAFEGACLDHAGAARVSGVEAQPLRANVRLRRHRETSGSTRYVAVALTSVVSGVACVWGLHHASVEAKARRGENGLRRLAACSVVGISWLSMRLLEVVGLVAFLVFLMGDLIILQITRSCADALRLSQPGGLINSIIAAVVLIPVISVSVILWWSFALSMAASLATLVLAFFHSTSHQPLRQRQPIFVLQLVLQVVGCSLAIRSALE
mmetsp:Transcript_56793/g.184740  ORF Transcript_56793/g.184740 Transcript_56793/m.184740 type:complete len:264 (-) Transcript_56793:126-917(-)